MALDFEKFSLNLSKRSFVIPFNLWHPFAIMAMLLFILVSLVLIFPTKLLFTIFPLLKYNFYVSS